jgi:hypothetical protein
MSGFRGGGFTSDIGGTYHKEETVLSAETLRRLNPEAGKDEPVQVKPKAETDNDKPFDLTTDEGDDPPPEGPPGESKVTGNPEENTTTQSAPTAPPQPPPEPPPEPLYVADPDVPPFMNSAADEAIQSLNQEEKLEVLEANTLAQQIAADAAKNGQAQQQQQRTSALAALFAGLSRPGTAAALTRRMEDHNHRISEIRSQKIQISKTVKRMNTLWKEAEKQVDLVNARTFEANLAYDATTKGQDIKADIAHFAKKNNISEEAIMKRIASGDKSPEIEMLRNKQRGAWKSDEMAPVRSMYANADAAGQDLTNHLDSMRKTLKSLKDNGANVDGYNDLPNQLESMFKQNLSETKKIKNPGDFDLEKSLKDSLESLRNFFTSLLNKVMGFGGSAKSGGGMKMGG